MTEEIPSSSLDAATLSQKGRPSLPVATSSPEVASTASSESIVSMTSKVVQASSDEGGLSPQKRSLPSPVAPSSGIAAEAAAPASTIPTPAPTPPATKKTKAREVLALTSIASRTPRMEADITTRLPARKKRKACPSDEPNASATDSRLVSVSVPGQAFTTQLPALITPLLDESESDDVDQEEVICESERKRKRDVLLAANGDVNVYQDGEEGEYEIMVSDGPSENESSDFDDSRLASLDFTADWGDDAVAAYMADVSSDINDDDALLALAKNKTEIKEWETTGWGEVQASTAVQHEYPGLYQGEWGPTQDVLRHADSPINLFWFFFPKALLHTISDESNRYARQTVVARARKIRDRQVACKGRGSRQKDVETLKQIRQRLRKMDPFEPHEFAVVFGLLIARMLCPQKRRLSTHWSTSSVGAIPSGTFGAWMPRNRFVTQAIDGIKITLRERSDFGTRFDEIMRHLHFSDNTDPMAKQDRAWKIRPIINTLQTTFIQGYTPGPVLSFDEGMLPSHSKFNGTRTYMRDKPHKWGTKMFLTCCPRTSYCLRLEVYCGKKAHLSGPQTIDDKSGPAAVLRNMDKVLPKDRRAHYTVVIDRFYTSVALALELLANKIYSVGTIQTRRIGFPNELKDKRKKRPKDVPRGSYKIMRSKSVSEMSACCWWDSKPVYLLATGASTQDLSISRNTWVKGEPSEVPCPKLVKDYHHGMGGVDVHDQLRLQRYSVQMAFTFKKYYKTLFLGLLDMAIVNAYVVHRTHYTRIGRNAMSHSAFLTTLHAQLLAVTQSDMVDSQPQRDIPPAPCLPPPTRVYRNLAGHTPSETEDFHGEVGDPGRKRMHRACKVCSLLAAPGKRGKNTKWLCLSCSKAHTGDVYLCQLVRHESFGVKKSCFAIWHEDWEFGSRVPFNLDKRLQYRKPTGKKRQAKRPVQATV